MSERIVLGVLAAVAGFVVGVGMFVPFVALSVRRRGRITVGRTLLWAAALVYFWALWAYTLLPLPDPAAFTCAGTNLNLLQIIADLHPTGGPAMLLHDPGVQQVALNVVLFLPLGFFVRVLGGRGVLIALLAGLGVSLLIEVTQLTGLAGVYPCAYRVFDVDDLLTNTAGAVLGSLSGLLVPWRFRGRGDTSGAGMPQPVTRGRRALAILCDLVGASVLTYTVAIVARTGAVAAGAGPEVVDGPWAAVLPTVVVALTWLVVVATTGRTIGDLAVELRYAGGRVPEPLARLLRFVSGVGGYMLLQLLPAPWSILAPVFFVVAAVAWLTTKAGRGLPGLVTGRFLRDAREGAQFPGGSVRIEPDGRVSGQSPVRDRGAGGEDAARRERDGD